MDAELSNCVQGQFGTSSKFMIFALRPAQAGIPFSVLANLPSGGDGMSDAAIVLAKLSGIRKALVAARDENVSRNRGRGETLTRASFVKDLVEHYFSQAAILLKSLSEALPDLYGDFQFLEHKPEQQLAQSDGAHISAYSRAQVERLVRDIDQIFEIRANSELEQPRQVGKLTVFITHGHSSDWREVQPFIEKDVRLATIELAQEANRGRTIIEKLFDNSDQCDSAVIVMTGDDVANGDESRVRENVT